MDTINANIPDITLFSETVTLLGGGELSAATVSEVLTRAPNLVVCDGAAEVALEMGQVPAAVIGDMDSIAPETRSRLDPASLIELSEQETTDFDKALRTIRAPLVLGVGFMGARLDHELAAYNVLVRHPDRPCILVGETDICFHMGKSVRLEVAPGTRVSLFPMAEVRASSRGLEWELDRLTLSPWGRVGTSNRARGPVEVEAYGDGLLVIMPRDQLDVAIAALAPTP